MASPRSPSPEPPVAKHKRGASAVPKASGQSIPAAGVKAKPVLAFKPATARRGTSTAAVRLATKGTVPPVTKRRPKVTAPATHHAPALSYLTVYRASPLERIDMIRRGILASDAKRLFAELPIGQGAGFKALNLSTATVNKKARQGDTLSPVESERIVGFAKLVGQLEAMIQDSGDPAHFDTRTWMARWLTEPLPAFGGARPADLMDTMEGQGLISVALAQIQSGAYA